MCNATWTLFVIVLLATAAARVSSEVHAFFYLWYGAPAPDGAPAPGSSKDEGWKHWNHEVLPHWTEQVNSQYPEIGSRFTPPGNLHSPFYPLNGPYSSRDPAVVVRQIDDMVRAGISVAVLSWWGQAEKPYATDTQGVNTDRVLGEVLQIFDSDGSRVKVAFHLEPYPGRSVASVREDIEYLLTKYGHHSSLHRSLDGRPWCYVYDSYHQPAIEWARLLSPEGDLSIRGSAFDAVVIGLWLSYEHGRDLSDGRFDGIYSYFASEGFSYGSTTGNWRSICQAAHRSGMLCSLSVGPGYNDTRIRPWNNHNTRGRDSGAYYEAMWEMTLRAGADIVSVTSFNEWGEGTQIEPAAVANNSSSYIGYGEDPNMYLDLTKLWADRFSDQQKRKAPEL